MGIVAKLGTVSAQHHTRRASRRGAVQPTVQSLDLDTDAPGPDGVTIKGNFLVGLLAEHELSPEPCREYPCELTDQIGETVTNTVTFMAKVRD